MPDVLSHWLNLIKFIFAIAHMFVCAQYTNTIMKTPKSIWQLNREIAQHVFNKKASTEDSGTVNASNNADADSALLPLAVDTKRDLLYKIHVKNKYIKRLLSENEALKEEIEQQKQQILVLNVSLKQTTHKLTKAIGELSEQKNQNHMTADDMTDLHAKINSVREQMTRIEMDKQKYKHDVLYLGDEIQKKIIQWNEMLKRKCIRYQIADKTFDDHNEENKPIDNGIDRIANEIAANHSNQDENRFEVNILSQAINKRNLIITEMESLLIDLTMEISQSAAVINRIIKNLSKRETNFASNLDKLRNHLVKLLERPNAYDLEHEPEHDAQIENGKKLLDKTFSTKTLKRKTIKKNLTANQWMPI